MNDIRRSALLPYSAERVYALINDVEAYPQYMDGCVGAEILPTTILWKRGWTCRERVSA